MTVAEDATTGYRIEVSQTGKDGTWTDLEADTGGTGTTYEHAGLTPGTTRHYRVSANNANGVSGPSNEASATTDGLHAPSDLTATAIGQTRIDLSWTAPTVTVAEDATTGYRIEVSQTGKDGTWTDLEADTGGTGTTYEHAGLTPGTTRHYRVSANNANGVSGPSNEASATTDGLHAPSDLTATAIGPTRIELAWTAPTVPVAEDATTGYRIEASPTGADGSWTDLAANTGSTGTAYIHTDLAAQTTRHYRVSTINANGTSEPSNVASAMTAKAELPGAPTGLTALVAGKKQIFLAWTAPADTGGSAITGYRIEVSPSGTDGTWTDLEADTGSAATTYSHGGLQPGTTRHYRVSAVNAVGTGDPSNEASAETIKAGDISVDDLTATANGHARIDLAWTAPSLPPGVSVAGYGILVSPSGKDGTWTILVSNTGSAATTYSHTGLTAATTRYYRTDTAWTVGNQEATLRSNVASATTTAAAPDPPTGLTATAGGPTWIDLAWTAPADTGGSAITGYLIEVSPSGADGTWTALPGEVDSEATTEIHADLTPGTRWYYRLSAINAIGTSRPSNVATARAGDVPPPGAPTGLAATPAASGEVALSWTAPSVADVTITEYFVQYESDSLVDLAEFNTGSTDTAFTVTGLRPGTTFTFHVRAVLSDGKASPSATATATTPAATGKPGKPAGLTARALGPTHVTLSWTPAAGQGVTGYRIDHSPNGVDQWKTAESDTGTTHPGSRWS